MMLSTSKMKPLQVVNVGVLTYVLLGLFNYVQHGVLLFSYPLVPLFLFIIFCIAYLNCRPALDVKNIFLGVFVLLHFLFSPFLLEIVLPFELQLKLAVKEIPDLIQLVAYLFLLLGVHQNLIKKGQRAYNLLMGIVVAGLMFGYLYLSNLMFNQLFLAGSGLIGGIGGYFLHKRKMQFSDAILLVIGMLYLLSNVNWILV